MATQTRTAKERKAKAKLVEAIDRVAYARGQAQWVNGYRVGKNPGEPADTDLYNREIGWWKQADARESAVKRALAAYRRAILSERS